MSQDAQTAPAVAPDHEPGWRPARRGPIVTTGIVLAAFIACAAVLYAWQLPPFDQGDQSTENATVEGQVTVIAPQVSGYVREVLVRDYQMVRKGDVLVRIDDGIYRARVAQAKANVDAQLAQLANSRQAYAARTADLSAQVAGLGGADAQLLKAKADMERADDLVRDGSIAKREYDQTLAALRAAQAQVRQSQAGGQIAREAIRTVEVARQGLQADVEAARAALQLAQIDLEHTVIRAPADGQVGQIGVRLGQFVAPGSQLFSLVPPEHWIIANYKETQTNHIAVGQRVTIWVDALGGAKLRGRVQRIAPAAGSEFAVLKPDNATGNFVKVPQRIGVYIRVDPGQKLAARLRPGMSVETRVETGR